MRFWPMMIHVQARVSTPSSLRYTRNSRRQYIRIYRMEMLETLLDHPHAEALGLLFFGTLCLIGLVQVVRKGLALVLWLVMFTVGLLPVAYILSGSDSAFLNSARDAVTDARSSAPGIGSNVIKRWCATLDDVCR